MGGRERLDAFEFGDAGGECGGGPDGIRFLASVVLVSGFGLVVADGVLPPPGAFLVAVLAGVGLAGVGIHAAAALVATTGAWVLEALVRGGAVVGIGRWAAVAVARAVGILRRARRPVAAAFREWIAVAVQRSAVRAELCVLRTTSTRRVAEGMRVAAYTAFGTPGAVTTLVDARFAELALGTTKVIRTLPLEGATDLALGTLVVLILEAAVVHTALRVRRATLPVTTDLSVLAASVAGAIVGVATGVAAGATMISAAAVGGLAKLPVLALRGGVAALITGWGHDVSASSSVWLQALRAAEFLRATIAWIATEWVEGHPRSIVATDPAFGDTRVAAALASRAHRGAERLVGEQRLRLPVG